MLRDRIADAIYTEVLTTQKYVGKAGYVVVSPHGERELFINMQWGDNVMARDTFKGPSSPLYFFGRFEVVVSQEMPRDTFRIAVNL